MGFFGLAPQNIPVGNRPWQILGNYVPSSLTHYLIVILDSKIGLPPNFLVKLGEPHTLAQTCYFLPSTISHKDYSSDSSTFPQHQDRRNSLRDKHIVSHFIDLREVPAGHLPHGKTANGFLGTGLDSNLSSTTNPVTVEVVSKPLPDSAPHLICKAGNEDWKSHQTKPIQMPDIEEKQNML